MWGLLLSICPRVGLVWGHFHCSISKSCFCFRTVSPVPSCLQIRCVAEDNLELPILLSPLFHVLRLQGCTSRPSFTIGLGIETRASCKLGKCSTNYSPHPSCCSSKCVPLSFPLLLQGKRLTPWCLPKTSPTDRLTVPGKCRRDILPPTYPYRMSQSHLLSFHP